MNENKLNNIIGILQYIAFILVLTGFIFKFSGLLDTTIIFNIALLLLLIELIFIIKRHKIYKY